MYHMPAPPLHYHLPLLLLYPPLHSHPIQINPLPCPLPPLLNSTSVPFTSSSFPSSFPPLPYPHLHISLTPPFLPSPFPSLPPPHLHLSLHFLILTFTVPFIFNPHPHLPFYFPLLSLSLTFPFTSPSSSSPSPSLSGHLPFFPFPSFLLGETS